MSSRWRPYTPVRFLIVASAFVHTLPFISRLSLRPSVKRMIAARCARFIRALREKRRRLMVQLAQAADDEERADLMTRVLAMDHAIQKEQAQLGAVKVVTAMLLESMKRLRARRAQIDIDAAVKACAAIWLGKVSIPTG